MPDEGLKHCSGKSKVRLSLSLGCGGKNARFYRNVLSASGSGCFALRERALVAHLIEFGWAQA